MRDRALPLLFVLLLTVTGRAQVLWQPTPPPLVTAENTAWYQAGEPIEWNGAIYYPAGAIQFFNRYQMVRSGFFRGIPLYTDATLEPNITVFVPLSGGRMQPYQLPRTGQLAGTSGNRPMLIPDEILSHDPSMLPGINQAAAPPAHAAAYDFNVEPLNAPFGGCLAALAAAACAAAHPVAAVEESAPMSPTQTVTSFPPPIGLNSIWINYAGRRWVSEGRTIPYDAIRLTEAGTYRGWSVYTRAGEPSTIYLPATPGRLTAYTSR